MTKKKSKTNPAIGLSLGLCCMSEGMRHCGKEWRFRTMTKSAAQKHPDLTEDGLTLVDQLLSIYSHNIKCAGLTAKQARDIGCSHYRLSSAMFPLVGCPGLDFSLSWLKEQSAIVGQVQELGEKIRKLNLTVSSHPDQFVVLSSHKPYVARCARRDLEIHAWLHDTLGFPADYSNPMNIHVGLSKDDAGPSEIARRWLREFEPLSDSVKNRLVLENDDKSTWTCAELWKQFSREGIPLTFDNWHYACNPDDSSAQDWATRFKSTWNRVGQRPIFHWSEGDPDAKNRRQHIDYYTHVPDVVTNNRDVIWECEIKQKDLAIKKLLEQ
jgi:UV DNA damage endonuclease